MAGSARDIFATLAATSELSSLYSIINSSRSLTNLLNSTDRFTFLAPSNEAISQWNSSAGGNLSRAVVDSTLTYHLLNGSYPSISFTSEPQFAQSFLTNRSYSNVTKSPAGQRVELFESGDGVLNVASGRTNSTITSKDLICFGGLVQVINSVLSIPKIVSEFIVEANLSYFTAILNESNFLSIDKAGLVEFINNATYTPDITFFIPNSALALEQFVNMTLGISAEELGAIYNYHIFPNVVAYSPSLTNGTTFRSQEGSNVTITRDGTDIYVNSAKVIARDFLTANGVVHVIDSLLQRNNASIPDFIPCANATPLSPSSTPSSTTKSDGGLSTGAKAAIGVVIPVIILAAIGIFAFWFLKRRRKHSGYAAEKSQSGTENGIRREISIRQVRSEVGDGQTASELEAPRRRSELDAGHLPSEVQGQNRYPSEMG